MKIRIGKDEASYCINRVTAPGKSPAFQVVVKRQGIHVRKRFNPSYFGSESAALEAARAWRDRVLALLPPMTYRELHTLRRHNNQSGIPGVFRTKEPTGAYWVAVRESGGKKTSRKLSVSRYGEEGARQRAIAARQEMLQSAANRFWVATEASLDLTSRSFADPAALAASDAVVWDETVREQFLAKLRAEGLIGKPLVSPVRRRHYPGSRGPIWEVAYSMHLGRRVMRRFSVARHGEEAAERLAREAYERLRAEHDVGFVDGPGRGRPGGADRQQSAGGQAVRRDTRLK